MFDLFDDYTLRIVALGALALGMTSGVLGTFAVLRKQSLLGDAISHAALPGIAIAYVLTSSKTPLVLVIGAGVAGWLGALAVMTIVRLTRIKQDTALALVLSVFFGIGLVWLTYIQRSPDAGQAGLDSFLFGQAAAMLERDVITMSVLGGIAILAVAIFWKEFKLLAFDPGYAATLGFPVRFLEVLLTTLLVIAIVIGLQAVGVVLMSAMVVAPAAAARQWTDKLWLMVVVAAGVGAVSGVGGAVVSSDVENLPTGPTIVLIASAIVMLSFAFAPRRGLVARSLRQRRAHGRLRAEALLGDLYRLARHHDDRHPHTAEAIGALRPGLDAERLLQELASKGFVLGVGDGWVLTEKGKTEAIRVVGDESDPERDEVSA